MLIQPCSESQIAEPPITVDWGLAFSRRETSEAYAYWDSIRGERAMPTRRELSPRGMREFLTYVGLVDVQPAVEGTPVAYNISLELAHGREVFGQLAPRDIEESFRRHGCAARANALSM